MPGDVVMLDSLAMEWHAEKLTRCIVKASFLLGCVDVVDVVLLSVLRKQCSCAIASRDPALLNEYVKQCHG